MYTPLHRIKVNRLYLALKFCLLDSQKPLAMDDSDALSLTSTVSSEKQDQYFIDKILAERVRDGVNEYLVAWEGYPEHCHTWEPLANFTSAQTIHDWEHDCMRITRGLDQPFDVTAWGDRVAAIWQETRDRKKTRKRKRRDAGWQLDEDSDSAAAEDSDEYIESDTVMERSTSKQQNAPLQAQPNAQRVPSSRPPAKAPKLARGDFQETDHHNQMVPREWSDEEVRALEIGLKHFGHPWMDRILGLYGKRGTVSKVLKEKSLYDLRSQAFTMKEDFINLNRTPPEYLAEVTDPNDNLQTNPQDISNQQLSLQPESIAKRYAGTAKPTARSRSDLSNTASLQLGSIGSGPARQSTVPKQVMKSQVMPQRDVAAKWNAIPLVQKRQPSSSRNFKNPKHRYNANKRNTTEPTPDIDSLVFIDPKTGRATGAPPLLNPVSGASSTDNPRKSDVQQYFEGRTAARLARMNDQADEPNIEQEMPLPETSSHTLASAASQHTAGRQNASKIAGPPLTFQNEQLNPPIKVPTAPKAQIQWQRRHSGTNVQLPPTSTMMQDTDQVSPYPAHTTRDKPSSSLLEFRKWPTRHKRRDLQRIYETNLVTGIILTKHAGKVRDIGKVRFMGLKSKPEKKLLLSIKRPDGRADFGFFRSFTASEYALLPPIPIPVSPLYYFPHMTWLTSCTGCLRMSELRLHSSI